MILSALLLLSACAERAEEEPAPVPELPEINARNIACILSELPLQQGHLREVHDAVSGSCTNGYDEEYMMSDLFESPGCGVGGTGTKAVYDMPLRDLFSDYFKERHATKAGGPSPEEFISALSASDMQIYWPFSSDWDGSSYPIITFDPGYGAESNIGYEISFASDGSKVVEQVIVDESVAARRPVWVVNRNDDSAFTPLEFFLKGKAATAVSAAAPETKSSRFRTLKLVSVKMLRNYDSWFAGASEFFFKCGAVEGFKASTEAELKLYNPRITDFMFVVRRRDLGVEVPLDGIVITDFTSQLDKLALLITEDDGGTRTNWKAECSVKVQSKSYGFTIDMPYNDKDDIVWRGQVAASYFEKEDVVTGRFGDLVVRFALE